MNAAFPQLPVGWQCTRIDRVATVSARIGWKALTAAEYQPDGYVFLSTPNIKNEQIDFDNVNYISAHRYDESPELKLAIGDVLLAKDGNTLGITNIVTNLPRPATVNGSIAVIRPFRIEPRFLRYVLSSHAVQGLISALKDGMGVPHLFQWDIKRLPVPLPPSHEQSRIADFLDRALARLNVIIDGRHRSLELLAERLDATIDQLVRGASASDVVPALFAPLGMVPSKWKQGRLRAIPCEVQTGPFGSQLHADEYVEGGWPVINPANIQHGHLVPDPRVTVSERTQRRLARHVLHAGDVVFGRRGELGRAAIVTAEEDGWICGTGTLRVRFHRGTLDPAYLRRYLSIPAIRYYFETQAVGSTMGNLSSEILLGMPLLIPPMEEQRRIAQQCQEVEDAISSTVVAIKQQLRLLTEWRHALVSAAISGQSYADVPMHGRSHVSLETVCD